MCAINTPTKLMTAPQPFPTESVAAPPYNDARAPPPSTEPLAPTPSNDDLTPSSNVTTLATPSNDEPIAMQPSNEPTGSSGHQPCKVETHQKLQTRLLTKKVTLLMFVKFLLKIVDLHSHPILKEQVKQIVLDCTHNHQQGHSDFVLLQEVVEKRLRRKVGELLWSRTKRSFESYCDRKGLVPWND